MLDVELTQPTTVSVIRSVLAERGIHAALALLNQRCPLPNGNAAM